MRKFFIIAGTTLALIVTPSVASAQPVQSLSGDWSASNSTVTKVTDGIHFGTYANGGLIGGSVFYKGFTGKLGDVSTFSFTSNYRQSGETTGATPYGRIWLDKDGDGEADATVIFDPSLGGLVMPVQGVDTTFGSADNSVRYSDDKGDGPQQTWTDVKAAHADEVIVKVGVSQGFSMGADVSAMLKSLTIGNQSFEFNVPPADGKPGANGTSGTSTTTTNTVIQQVAAAPKVITGGTVRTLHVTVPKGAKFLGAKAVMRNVKLPVKGRTITVDLRNKTVGNYNVFITVKYAKHGKKFTVKSVRNLSVHTA
jgi:hypothetical protein